MKQFPLHKEVKTMDNTFIDDVKLARKGDTEAFARLYKNVYKDMYRIALCCLKNSHDACDAVSDAVLDAFTSIGNLKNENAFRKWMFRILSAKIKRIQRGYFADTVELTEACEPVVDFNCEITELKHAFETLDPRSRLILSLTVTGGYTGEEISQICGINANTVRSVIARAKKKLRLELE